LDLGYVLIMGSNYGKSMIEVEVIGEIKRMAPS
jgi:hypothetical protein